MELNYEVELSNHKHWMVFIHGAGGSINTWKHQRTVFKDYANLLFIDLRDHGESHLKRNVHKQYTFDLMAKDVINILDKLYIDKACFVGLSLGGLIIEKIRLLDSSRISTVVLAGGMFNVSPMLQAFSWAGLVLSHLLPYKWNYWLFSWLIMPRSNHQRARQVYVNQAKKLSGKAYRKWVRMYKEFNGLVKSINSQNLRYPMLIVMGSEDYMFLKSAKKFALENPKAELKEIKHCGHICNIEQYESFNALALDFFLKNTVEKEHHTFHFEKKISV